MKHFFTKDNSVDVQSAYLYLIRQGGVGLELYRALGNPGSIHTYIAIPSRYGLIVFCLILNMLFCFSHEYVHF
jgi:hypothetical protein